VLESINGDTVAAQAKMARAKMADTILIVEGVTDYRFLQPFLDGGCSMVIAHGKKNAMTAISKLGTEGVDGCLAFVDADFDRIDGSIPDDTDVVVSDFHDVEVMMLMSPALDKVLEAYGSQKKLSSFLEKNAIGTVRDYVFRECFKMGELRHKNKLKNWRLRFQQIDHKKFVDAVSLRIKIKEAVRVVLANSGDVEATASEILEKLHLEIEGKNLSEFCCGHDCSGLVAIGLRQCLGSNKGSVACKQNVEKMLQLAYEESYLVKSNMFRQVRQWENRNPGFTVMRPLAGETSG
jgi:hypothetical protein